MQRILLTGASSGVGATIAERLVTSGHKVAGLARSMDKLQAQASAWGDNYVPLQGDLGAIQSIPQIAQRTTECLDGTPDVLIHNAGTFHLGEFETHNPRNIEAMHRINALSPMLLTQQFLTQMKQRKSGKIIVIAPVAGTHGLPGQATYCASKHALVGFTDALSAELKGSGVCVNTLCPGGIDTPLWRSGEVTYPGDLDATMKPEELADLVEFLLKQPNNTRYRRIIFFPDGEWH